MKAKSSLEKKWVYLCDFYKYKVTFNRAREKQTMHKMALLVDNETY